MSDLAIQRVATYRQRKQFLEFPWTLYRGDPNWIPPLRLSQKELVGYAAAPVLRTKPGADVLGHARRRGLRPDRRHSQPGTQRTLPGAPRLLRFLRVRRRPGGGRRPAGRRAAMVRRPGHLLSSRADQSVAELRGGHADRRLRLSAHLHDDLQSALLRAVAGELRLPQDPGPVRLLGPHRHAAEDQGETRPGGRADHRALQRPPAVHGHLALPGGGADVPLDLQPLAGEHLGIRAHVAGRGGPHGGRAAAPDRARTGHRSPRSTARWSAPCSACPTTTRGFARSTAGCFPPGCSASSSARTASSGSASSRPTSFPNTSGWAWAWCWSAASCPRCWPRGCKRRSFPGCWNPIRSPAGPCRRGAPSSPRPIGSTISTRPPGGPAWQPKTASLVRPAAAAARQPLEIRPLQTRRDLRQFIQVPAGIYADDPHWVPPLAMEVKEFLDRRKHPFYLHGEATQFLALRGGVPRDASSSATTATTTSSTRPTSAASACSNAPTIPRWPRPCWTLRPAGSAAAAARASWDPSTIRSTIPAGCWSTASTPRRGS